MGNVWQAWHVLSNLQISCRSYVKPGKTVQVKNLGNNATHGIGSRTISQGSFDIDRSSGCMQTHKNFSKINGEISEPACFMGNHFESSNIRVVKDEKSQIRASIVNNSHSQNLDSSVNDHAVHIGQVKGYAEFVAGDVDDDDILEVISITL